jgi:hypothetical protein
VGFVLKFYWEVLSASFTRTYCLEQGDFFPAGCLFSHLAGPVMLHQRMATAALARWSCQSCSMDGCLLPRTPGPYLLSPFIPTADLDLHMTSAKVYFKGRMLLFYMCLCVAMFGAFKRWSLVDVLLRTEQDLYSSCLSVS